MTREVLHADAVACLIASALLAGSIASAGEIYVPNYGDADVSVLDADSLATLARIPLHPGERLAAVAFSSDGAFAFIALYASDKVAVIDTESR